MSSIELFSKQELCDHLRKLTAEYLKYKFEFVGVTLEPSGRKNTPLNFSPIMLNTSARCTRQILYSAKLRIENHVSPFRLKIPPRLKNKGLNPTKRNFHCFGIGKIFKFFCFLQRSKESPHGF